MNKEQNNRYLADIEIAIQSLSEVLESIQNNSNDTYPDQTTNLWNLRVLKSISVELGENVDYNVNKFCNDYRLYPKE